MTPLWMVFTFLNLWWIAAYIVIAFQHQRTDQLKKTFIYATLLSALVTGMIAWLMELGLIGFI